MSKRKSDENAERNVRPRTADEEEFTLDLGDEGMQVDTEPEFTLDAELFQNMPASSAEAAALPTPPLPRPFAVLDDAGQIIAQNDRGIVQAVPPPPRNNTAFINRHVVPEIRPNQNFVNTVPRLNPQLRQAVAYTPEADEVVLTSLLIFGAFYDAGFPTEVVRVLAQAIIDVHRARVALSYYFLPPGNFHHHQPIFICPAAEKPGPLVLVSRNASFGSLENFDRYDHASVKDLSFETFIDMVFNNVCQLLEAKRTCEILEIKFVERIKAMVGVNYPGQPFYITSFNPSFRGAHTAAELPEVTFNLIDSSRKESPPFSFRGLNFRSKKAYITVILGDCDRDSDDYIGPGVSSFDGGRMVVANPALNESPGVNLYRIGYHLTLPNRMTFNLSTSYSPDRFTFIVSSFDKETFMSKKY